MPKFYVNVSIQGTASIEVEAENAEAAEAQAYNDIDTTHLEDWDICEILEVTELEDEDEDEEE